MQTTAKAIKATHNMKTHEWNM